MRRRAESVRYVFLAIFAALVLAFLFDGNVEGNELDTFALAKARIDPTYLVADFRCGLAPGPRLPFQLLLSPLLRVMSFEAASITGRLALYALLALGLARLAVRARLVAYGALVAGGLFAYLGQHLVAGEFLVLGLESKTLAYALALLALDQLLARRLVSCAAMLGLAFTFHPLVGVWCAVALAAAAVSVRPRADAKDLARCASAFAALAAPGLWLVISSLRGHADAEGTFLYVYFRHPHHLDPGWFLGHRVPKIRIAVATAIFIALYFVKLATVELRALARFAQATMVIFCGGLIVSCFSHAERALSTYPFRVADTLFPLFVIALGTSWLVPKIPVRVRRTAMPAAALVVGVAAARAAVLDVAHAREREREPLRVAYRWVREHTEADALVLASPGLEYAGLHMERPTVVSGKAVPTDPGDVREWYRRLVDLNGAVPPKERGFPAFEEIDRTFGELPNERYTALAAKYHARYLLLRHGRALPYRVVYDDGAWTVYELA